MMNQTFTKKPSYVCATCGQDFTRRYNANRHNQNLHSNRAEVVRFLEYLVGRISGKYLPGDPLSYRIKNRSKNKSSFVHETNTNNFKQTKSSLHSNENLRHIAQPNKENITYNTNNSDLNFKDSPETVPDAFDGMNYFNNLYHSLDTKAKEMMLRCKIEEKLDDIERMLYDFYPNHGASWRIGNLQV